MLRKALLYSMVMAFVVSAAAVAAGEKTLVLFTSRPNAADKEAVRDFTVQTGIHMQIVEGKADELIERIVGGEHADLFMTVDGGILDRAGKKGVFLTTVSDAIREAVPDNLRDRDFAWVGVTTRARILAYSRDRVDPAELSSYQALADPKWKGKILVRGSSNLYNQSLVASLVRVYGEAETAEWAKGLAANFAREPKGNDRDQAKVVAAGEGDIAIMNTYYIGQMLKSNDSEEVEAAKAVGVFFPDQDGTGTHINICGIGLTRDCADPDAALRLVEYLLSVPVQEKFSLGNSEFPVNPKAAKAPLLASWGDFKTKTIDFAALDDEKDKATAIFAGAGWK